MSNTKKEIVVGKMLNDKQHEDVNELENISFAYDGINLKLELDYKKIFAWTKKMMKMMSNEFLYYIDDVLAAYVGICSFGLKRYC